MNKNVISLANFNARVLNDLLLKNGVVGEEYWENLRSEYQKSFADIDLRKCSCEELKALGFGRWEEESKLMLIPASIANMLDQEMQVVSISGMLKVLKNAGTDIRFGMRSVGIIPKTSLWAKVKTLFNRVIRG